MSYFEDIKNQIYKFEHLGKEIATTGALLIGKAPHIAQFAWLHAIYVPLTMKEILELESELNTEIPESYKYFLMNYSNGLSLFVAEFYLDGMRKKVGRSIDSVRQPYSIITTNIEERPSNAKENYFFIGGYKWDGSHIYIDTKTNKVHFCDPWDATSLFEWNSFEEMIVSEVKRFSTLFNSDGIILDDDLYTTPIEIE